jgi:hypothetical protein
MFPANPDFGSRTILSTVLEEGKSLKWRMTDIKPIFASKSANLMAKHALGPWPKLRKAYLKILTINIKFNYLIYSWELLTYGGLAFFASFEKFSGLNTSGPG